MTTEPLILENPETVIELELEPVWQVVVHDDPINLMSYVTMVFQKIFGFSKEIAEKKNARSTRTRTLYSLVRLS